MEWSSRSHLKQKLAILWKLENLAYGTSRSTFFNPASRPLFLCALHSRCPALPYFLCFLYLSSVLQTKRAVSHWFTYFNTTAVSLKKMYLTRASFPSLSLSSTLSYVSHSFPFLPQYIVSSPISRLLFRHFHPECAASSVSHLTCFRLVWKLSRVEGISLLKFQLTDFRNASPWTANENGIWMSLKIILYSEVKVRCECQLQDDIPPPSVAY